MFQQDMRERLKPTIVMLLDGQKNPWNVSPLVDEQGIGRKIMHALKPVVYDTDPKLSITK